MFAINTDGTGFATLQSFTADLNGFVNGTNSDGIQADFAGGALVLSRNTLYGQAYFMWMIFPVRLNAAWIIIIGG